MAFKRLNGPVRPTVFKGKQIKNPFPMPERPEEPEHGRGMVAPTLPWPFELDKSCDIMRTGKFCVYSKIGSDDINIKDLGMQIVAKRLYESLILVFPKIGVTKMDGL